MGAKLKGDEEVRMIKKKYIESVILLLAGGLAGAGAIWKTKKRDVKNWKEKSNRNRELMLLLNQWLKLKQNRKEIIDFFHERDIHSIAIYGMSYVGERLYDELKDSDIEIKYAIDKRWDEIYADIDIVPPEEELAETDAIIVTPVYFFEEVRGVLARKVKCPIISLADILYGI